jgi:hypothetical protein
MGTNKSKENHDQLKAKLNTTLQIHTGSEYFKPRKAETSRDILRITLLTSFQQLSNNEHVYSPMAEIQKGRKI